MSNCYKKLTMLMMSNNINRYKCEWLGTGQDKPKNKEQEGMRFMETREGEWYNGPTKVRVLKFIFA